MVLQLIADGQLDHSLVSFMPDSAGGEAQKAEFLAYLQSLPWPPLAALLPWWDRLAARIPLVHDQDAGTAYLSFVFGDILAADYGRVGFAVITESDFGVPAVDRVTEKPFKAIANRCPFLLVGQEHQLARLGKLGFEPYPMFDNGYDAIVDPAPRLEAVLAELRRLAACGVERLQALRDEMAPVADRNYHRLLEFAEPGMVDTLAGRLAEAVGQLERRPAPVPAAAVAWPGKLLRRLFGAPAAP